MDKLSERERILIIVLINLVAYYILFNGIVLNISNATKTKMEQYNELKAQKEILDIENIKTNVSNQNLKEVNAQNKEIEEKLFDMCNTEDIHNFVNGIVKKSGLTLSSIDIEEDNFSQDDENNQTQQEVVENNEIVYNVSMELSGDYDKKLNFIKNLESENKTISIADMDNLNKDNSATKFYLKIYAIKK